VTEVEIQFNGMTMNPKVANDGISLCCRCAV